MSLIRTPKTFNEEKLYLRRDVNGGTYTRISTVSEVWVIGYKGVGESPVPDSVIQYLASLPYTSKPTLVDILKMCLEHHETIEYEQIN